MPLNAVAEVPLEAMGKVLTSLTSTNHNAFGGGIPLEALGLEPDLRNPRLNTLPFKFTETYRTIL